MADNIITPEFRGAFVQVFKATAMKGQADSKPKYSVRAVFMPGTDITALKEAAKQAATEKWGNNLPKVLRSPFRKNEELENELIGVPGDAVVVTFSANEDRRPGVVDAKLQDIIDEADCYSGAWYRAQVRAFGYDTAGNKGVAFGLQNLQKLREGEPMGGRVPASKAFTAVENTEAKSASALFE
jgi:hypothetical protein